MVVLIATAIFAASDTSQILFIPSRWLYLIAFGIFAGLVYWAMFGLYRELHHIKTSVPRLVLDSYEPNLTDIAKIATTIIQGTPQTELIGVPTFTRIWVSNKPLSPELGVDAENVHAEVEFQGRQHQVRMSGRWAEVEESHDNLKTEQVNMPPNGKPFALDLIMKYKQDNEAYGYDNVAHRLVDGRNQKTLLEKGRYTIKVTLKCKGIDLPLLFTMQNPGSGEDINFSPLVIRKEGYRTE